MAYSLLQISETLLKADRSIYKIGQIAYEDMFSELDERLDYDRDVIFIYKKAIEYGDNYYVGTEKLDKIVERLLVKISIYDYGQLNPVYTDVSQTSSALPACYTLDMLCDVYITNPQEGQMLRYDESLGKWVNTGAGGYVRSTQTFTATLNQTVFVSSTPFDPNYIDVFLNGVKLNSSNYSTFGEYTITLYDGCLADDIIDLIIIDPVDAIIAPPSQSGNAGKFLTTDGTNLSWGVVPFNSLSGLALSGVTTGNFLRYNGTYWVNSNLSISDIPSLSSLYMSQSVYDTDGDGIVDDAEKITIVARNSTGATIYKGTIVYLYGSTGNRPNMLKAQANAEATSSGTFGVVIADTANNSDGQVARIGTLHDLDTRNNATHPFTTDVLVDGDLLWLSPTNAGYVTKTKPSAPNHIVFIGIVARTTPSFGRIIYNIANGFELEELHNVSINSGTLANGQTIVYNSATGLWQNSTLATNTNIYNTDGTLTSNRTVTMNGWSLDFSSDIRINGHNIGRGYGSGIYNLRFGDTTFLNLTTGYWNTAIGSHSLSLISTGYGNTALGVSALAQLSTGFNNTGIGVEAIYSITSGAYNTAVGRLAGYYTTTANGNVLVGYQTGIDLVTGSWNTIIGTNSGYGLVSGSGNTIIGSSVQLLPASLMRHIILADGNGTIRMVIGNDGSMIVGTSSFPTFSGYAKLQVLGAIQQSGVINSLVRANPEGVLVAAVDGLDYMSLPSQSGVSSGSILYTNGTSAYWGLNSSFYNNDGTLTSSRTITQNGFYVSFTGLVNVNTLTSNSTLTSFGVIYSFNTLSVGSSGSTYNSAILNIDSTTKGFLPPRMTSVQKDAISSPATGLIIYQTDVDEGLYEKTSSTWRKLYTPTFDFSIYSADGDLTSNRTVGAGAGPFKLTFNPDLIFTGKITAPTSGAVNRSYTNAYFTTSTKYAVNFIDYNQTVTAGVNTSTSYSFINAAVINTTSSAVGVVGQEVYVKGYGTTATSSIGLTGGYFEVTRGHASDAATTASGMIGLLSSVQTINGSSNPYAISEATMFKGITQLTSGVFTNVYANNSTFYIGRSSVTKAVTVTNLYGHYIDVNIGWTSGLGGTVTNYYAFYINTPTILTTGVLTNKWGIYAPDSLMNHYINGTLLVGGNTPYAGASKLQVFGYILQTGVTNKMLKADVTGMIIPAVNGVDYISSYTETDPIFSASPSASITGIKITNWDDAYVWVSNFPTQTGNSGKYLTTNGSTLSWATVSTGITSISIGSTITSATAGSIFFAGTAGVLAQDNAALFWDASNKRLGINITPSYSLDVKGLLTGAVVDNVGSFSSDAQYVAIRINATLATGNSQASLLFAKLGVQKWNFGTDFAANNTNDFFVYNAATSSNPIYVTSGGDIRLGSANTTSTGGYWSTQKMTIYASTGNVAINTTDNGYKFDVNGTSRLQDTATIGGTAFTTKLNASFGTFGIQSFGVNNGFLADNGYFDGSVVRYRAAGYTSTLQFFNGGIIIQTAASGAANATATMATKFWFKNGGDFSVGNQDPNANTGQTAIIYNNGTAIFGAASIVASAQVQVDSTTKGFLPPRMTAAQKTAISSPAAGLIIYQTDGVIGLYLYNGTAWKALTMV